MDQAYTVDSLKEFIQKILINKVNENDFMEFLIYLLNKESFNNIEEDFLSLLILNIFTTSNKMQNIIKDNIIYNFISEYVIKEKSMDVLENNVQEINLDDTELYDIKAYFENKVTSFSADSGIDFPAKGETIIINYKDNMSFPGRTFLMDFLVDDEGKVIKMIGAPIETSPEKPDFKAIYAGLVGEILEYQQVNE